ncbi:MAG: ABC transporter, ATP-binding protein (cluster 2, ribose/xylose/arabinose/galactose) / ABC transporter, ATP-binding protein (cluster 2, ribose/xylose/arabinose/galactose) [uncultured Paraburkholderia sp.]|nr:MAG: ABC transporter, ATP-binding protein (cluster 2, ribose/xylose/arabinose/galactose) / ABC transporter, ATP-binding protein (cluster 2, ribose/xylose/arabinose/galactose) [uncultured Paraburkholderia sp.]CAH2909232.1 MAG: ABC transporter, ATP-binding protein (cluster 2, ribose/xylose/arabinose/galactose) / ABC transporter, ATP-binding protein (cluster 2, ribose/xylose/arabinose/galactose) [uncultured Paraburkholderia sp.]
MTGLTNHDNVRSNVFKIGLASWRRLADAANDRVLNTLETRVTDSGMQPAAGLARERPAAREILQLKGVGKRFPGVVALDGIDLDLRSGEVHAVCGENGAGKSTLMKIISGQYRVDDGVMSYDGPPVQFSSTSEAQAAGIAIIHQELNLVLHLSVAENIYLAREPRRGPFVDYRTLNANAQRCLQRIGLNVSPTTLVGALSIAQQQMVEIAKALSLDARVLIMDEPTSSLTESETVQLFRIIRELRADGVAILYISHRLDEMAEIVDRVTVLRDGRHIATSDFAATTINEIVARMVGRSLDDAYPPRVRAHDHVLLRVRDLQGSGSFGPVSFDLRKGEILGFAGLMGAGRTEVARAIFGAERPDSGSILLGDTPVHIGSPREAIRHGIAYLSEDRKKDGLALSMPVSANITLANVRAIASRGFLRFSEETAIAERYVRELGIRTPTVRQIARNLSGGNQQKIVISKWLYRGSRILFFDEPTRGIDVGAKYAIYGLMDRLAADGVGVVLISSELPELLGMTDRIAVFHEGRITAVLDTGKTSQEEILHHASGRSHA